MPCSLPNRWYSRNADGIRYPLGTPFAPWSTGGPGMALMLYDYPDLVLSGAMVNVEVQVKERLWQWDGAWSLQKQWIGFVHPSALRITTISNKIVTTAAPPYLYAEQFVWTQLGWCLNQTQQNW